MRADQSPQSFQVQDRFGNVWPPGFRSRLTTHGDPLCILKPPKEVAMLANMKAAQAATASSAGGWGNGTIPGIGKVPEYIKLRPKPKPQTVTRTGSDRVASLQSQVLAVLRKRGPITACEIADQLGQPVKVIGGRLDNLVKAGHAKANKVVGRGRQWRVA